MKTKLWHLKVLIHCMDICKVSTSNLYRRYCSQLSLPRRKQFSTRIADTLMYQNKPVDRPLAQAVKGKSIEDVKVYLDKECLCLLQATVSAQMKQGIGLFFVIRKINAAFAKKRTVHTSCMKCRIHLCLTSERNNSCEFHNH